MNSSSYDIELKTALRAVTAASKVCMHIRQSRFCEMAISKQDRSPVTIADLASQAVIIQALLEYDTEACIVAEEDTDSLGKLKDTEQGSYLLEAVQSVVPNADWQDIHRWLDRGNAHGGSTGHFWTIDPIDGTKGFLRNEQYAVALAWIQNGTPTLGVLGCPNYPVHGFSGEDASCGMLFYGLKGSGACKTHLDSHQQSQSVPIEVESLESVSQARLCESVESGHSAHDVSASLMQRLGMKRGSLRIDSQCKYAAVANGDASLYLRMPTSQSYQEKIWDHAAGCVIATEAGATVTDIKGKLLDFSVGRELKQNRGILVAPSGIHQTVVEALKEMGG